MHSQEDLEYEERKELLKTKALASFNKYWTKAQKDGWRLNVHFDRKVVQPPPGHRAKDWGGYYFETENGIIVPHWFADFYPHDI